MEDAEESTVNGSSAAGIDVGRQDPKGLIVNALTDRERVRVHEGGGGRPGVEIVAADGGDGERTSLQHLQLQDDEQAEAGRAQEGDFRPRAPDRVEEGLASSPAHEGRGDAQNHAHGDDDRPAGEVGRQPLAGPVEEPQPDQGRRQEGGTSEVGDRESDWTKSDQGEQPDGAGAQQRELEDQEENVHGGDPVGSASGPPGSRRRGSIRPLVV